MEHLRHFQLAEDPFRNEPLTGQFFESGPHADALRRLDRGVRQAKGLCVLLGDAGAGKTLIVRRLLEGLEEELFEANLMVVLNEASGAEWLLRRFAGQLGVEETAEEREPLLAQVYEHLAIVREDGRHAVLIIDDAQALASPPALADLAALLRLEYEERRLLTLVLAGAPGLEAALARDPVLAHRVDVKTRIAPLDGPGTAAYLAHRIGRADGDPAIVEPEAVEALRRLGGGLPGRVNTLADNALFEAFLCGRSHLSRVDVERAHRDLDWEAAPPGPTGGAAAAAPVAPPARAGALEQAAEPQAQPVGGGLQSATGDTTVYTEGELALVDPADGPTPAATPPADEPALGDVLEELDLELDAVFTPQSGDPGGTALATRELPAPAPREIELGATSLHVPDEGPPKDEAEEVDDLFVELLDD